MARPGPVLLFLAAVCACLAVGCLATTVTGSEARERATLEAMPTEAAALPSLRVVYTEYTGANIAVWMTHAADLFRKHGLDVTLAQRNETGAFEALANDEVEVVVGSGTAALAAAAAGTGLYFVAGLVNTSPYRLMVVPGIEDPADLRGVRLGVGRPHSAQEEATRAALQALGLTPGDDVPLLQIGSAAERFAALEAGVVQGAAVVPPDTVLLARLGFQTLVDLQVRGAEAPSTQVVVAERLVREDPERVQRFVDALLEGIALAKHEPALAKRVLRYYLYTDDEAALDATYALFVERLLSRTPFPPERALRQGWTRLVEQGSVAEPRPVATLIQRHFVQAAIDSGLLGRLYDGR